MAIDSEKKQPTDQEIKEAVRRRYASAIEGQGGCCGPSAGCCGPQPAAPTRQKARVVDLAHYEAEQVASLPQDAVENAFGCGNPLSFAGVGAGQVVLDIGSGAGIDVLLAARIVGPEGRVIGLDMTPEMIERARANAAEAGAANVQFRLGDAEAMPVEDASVDWVISNCVINLAPDKDRVFKEILRVLKPGGRVSIADIVTGDLPGAIRSSLSLWASCVGGAVEEGAYLETMRRAGLVDVQVVARQHYDAASLLGFLGSNVSALLGEDNLKALLDSRQDLLSQVWSAKITARKP